MMGLGEAIAVLADVCDELGARALSASWTTRDGVVNVTVTATPGPARLTVNGVEVPTGDGPMTI